METKVFKIGEDFIVGQVGTQAGAGNVRIVNPMYALMTPQGIKLADILSVLTDDTEVVISADKIIYTVTPAKEILDGYQKSIDKSPIIKLTKDLVY